MTCRSCPSVSRKSKTETEDGSRGILVVKVQFKLMVNQRLNRLQSLKSQYLHDLHWGKTGEREIKSERMNHGAQTLFKRYFSLDMKRAMKKPYLNNHDESILWPSSWKQTFPTMHFPACEKGIWVDPNHQKANQAVLSKSYLKKFLRSMSPFLLFTAKIWNL